MHKAIIRHAYEATIDRVARLTTYVMAHELGDSEYELTERCRRLAIDDLILLAVSMRRLIEATKLVAICQNAQISTAKFLVEDYRANVFRDEKTSVWETLGTIIHSRSIQIWDNEVQLVVLERFTRDAIDDETLRLKSKRLNPICYIKSDKKQTCIFLDELCSRSTEILENVRDECDKNKIYLDSMFSEI